MSICPHPHPPATPWPHLPTHIAAPLPLLSSTRMLSVVHHTQLFKNLSPGNQTWVLVFSGQALWQLSCLPVPAFVFLRHQHVHSSFKASLWQHAHSSLKDIKKADEQMESRTCSTTGNTSYGSLCNENSAKLPCTDQLEEAVHHQKVMVHLPTCLHTCSPRSN